MPKRQWRRKPDVETKAITIRLPAVLMRRLRARAEAEGVSINHMLNLFLERAHPSEEIPDAR